MEDGTHAVCLGREEAVAVVVDRRLATLVVLLLARLLHDRCEERDYPS